MSENGTLKQHLTKTYQLTSSDVRKILTDYTLTIYKNNKQIREAICIEIKNKTNINQIAFNTRTNILNIFNN